MTPAAEGVRAYALDQDRPGCGPMAAPAEYPYVSETMVECPVWVTPIDGGTSSGATTPVLAPDGSALFVGTAAGTLYALDPADGAVLWGSNVGGGARVAAPPALAGGRLYVPTSDGRIVALDATGCGAAICPPLWEAATGTGASIGAQPAVAGGVVFTGSQDGGVHAFAAAGCAAPPCAPLWSASIGTAPVLAPVVSQGQLYIANGQAVRAYGLP